MSIHLPIPGIPRASNALAGDGSSSDGPWLGVHGEFLWDFLMISWELYGIIMGKSWDNSHKIYIYI